MEACRLKIASKGQIIIHGTIRERLSEDEVVLLPAEKIIVG